MKVLSYLEFHNLINPEWEDYQIFLSKMFKEDMQIRKFYSQPFRPEMICELFEGWNYDSLIAEYTDGNDVYFIRDTPIDAGIHAIEASYDDSTYIPIPRTLDDFINDAKRAGIELCWKTKDEF